MKNLLFFLLSVLLLTSCSDVLDKKITKETISQDMQVIREKYADVYTEKDYDAVAGYVVGAVLLSEKKILDKTYREVLEESKANRIAATEQYKKDLQAYNEQIKATAAYMNRGNR